MYSTITKISYVVVGLLGLVCLLNGINLLIKAVNKRLEVRLDSNSN